MSQAGCPICNATTGVVVCITSRQRFHFCPIMQRLIFWYGGMFSTVPLHITMTRQGEKVAPQVVAR